MLNQVEIKRGDPAEVYELVKKLGKGGSGLVFLARHRETGQTVALKQVNPSDDEEKELVKNEIALTLHSRHSNILNYFDTYEHKHSIWMVVELMEGCLYELIAQRAGKIPENHIAFICHEILQGLQYIHMQHRIHRDMKSDTLMIGSTGNVKLGGLEFTIQLPKSMLQEYRCSVTFLDSS